MNHNNLLLQRFSCPVPICCSNVSVCVCLHTTSRHRASGTQRFFSSKEYFISRLNPLRKFLKILIQAKQIQSELELPSLNLPGCRRLQFWIIRSYNPVRYNHLLPNPVELLAGRSAAVEMLFDSDLIKIVCVLRLRVRVCTCVCVQVCIHTHW